jgi:hypothetical protein
VLVAHRSAGRGVAEPTHEFGEGRAGLGGKYRACMAKVVPAQVISVGGFPGWVVDLLQRRGRHVQVVVSGGRKSSASRPGAVRLFKWSFTSGTRCGGIATSRMPALDLGGPTMNSPSTRTTPLRTFTRLVRRVDVAAAQLGQLAEAHRAPGGQQRHQLVAVGQLLDDDPHFV